MAHPSLEEIENFKKSVLRRMVRKMKIEVDDWPEWDKVSAKKVLGGKEEDFGLKDSDFFV